MISPLLSASYLVPLAQAIRQLCIYPIWFVKTPYQVSHYLNELILYFPEILFPHCLANTSKFRLKNVCVQIHTNANIYLISQHCCVFVFIQGFSLEKRSRLYGKEISIKGETQNKQQIRKIGDSPFQTSNCTIGAFKLQVLKYDQMLFLRALIAINDLINAPFSIQHIFSGHTFISCCVTFYISFQLNKPIFRNYV